MTDTLLNKLKLELASRDMRLSNQADTIGRFLAKERTWTKANLDLAKQVTNTIIERDRYRAEVDTLRDSIVWEAAKRVSPPAFAPIPDVDERIGVLQVENADLVTELARVRAIATSQSKRCITLTIERDQARNLATTFAETLDEVREDASAIVETVTEHVREMADGENFPDTEYWFG